MRKPRTDSPLAKWNDEAHRANRDELYSILRTSTYAEAEKWLEKNHGIDASTSGLSRWYKRENKKRLRERLRTSIDVSKIYDKKVDQDVLDRRMGTALKSCFFAAVNTGDTEAIVDFADVALEHSKSQREETKLERTLKAERELKELREEFAALKAENEQLRGAIADAGKRNQADPAEVMAALDASLGLKKPKQ